MQKYYTPDFLRHRSVLNKGDLPSYYIEDHHEAIVSRDLWDQAQREHKRRSMKKKAGYICRADYGLSGKLICGVCGAVYTHSTRAVQVSNGAAQPTEEAYFLRTGQWLCANGQRKRVKEKCKNRGVLDFSAQQSLAEIFFEWREEYGRQGEQCAFCREFDSIYQREILREKQEDDRMILLERELVRIQEQIGELEGLLRDSSLSQAELTAYFDILEEQKSQFVRRQYEKMDLERDCCTSAKMLREYREFLAELQKLPETNAAGEPWNIHGRAGTLFETRNLKPYPKVIEGLAYTGEEAAQAPDILPDVEHLSRKYIEKGVVMQDGRIVFTMTCKVRFLVQGHTRAIRDFLGYRRAYEDGSKDLLLLVKDVLNVEPKPRAACAKMRGAHEEFSLS